jgi:hypothetical protein
MLSNCYGMGMSNPITYAKVEELEAMEGVIEAARTSLMAYTIDDLAATPTMAAVAKALTTLDEVRRRVDFGERSQS